MSDYWRQFAEWIVEWAEPIAILTEAEAGSPTAEALQAIARKALEGDAPAQEQIRKMAIEIATMYERIDAEAAELARAGLTVKGTAAVIRRRYHLDEREALQAARNIKREHCPPHETEGALARWRKRDR